jgi:hypothetical protein
MMVFLMYEVKTKTIGWETLRGEVEIHRVGPTPDLRPLNRYKTVRASRNLTPSECVIFYPVFRLRVVVYIAGVDVLGMGVFERSI